MGSSPPWWLKRRSKMPVCETCGSVVKKKDVGFNEAYDRTDCPRCRAVGPVRDEKYVFSLLVTEQGVAATGRAPGLELTYADTWEEMGRRLAERREEPTPVKPVGIRELLKTAEE
jgi:hypothetical protein